MPERVQLKRTKGWRKPDGVIVVSRPSKWGNPFTVGEDVPPSARHWLVDPCDPNRVALVKSLYSLSTIKINHEQAAEAFGWWLIEQPHLMLSLHELEGHDLGCWCPLDQACHADVLLEFADLSGLPVGDGRDG